MNINQTTEPEAKKILERLGKFFESLRAPVRGAMIVTKAARKFVYGEDGALHRARRLQAFEITGKPSLVTNADRKARRQAQRHRRAQRSASR